LSNVTFDCLTYEVSLALYRNRLVSAHGEIKPSTLLRLLKCMSENP